jgi:hypothetical protein
MKLKFNNVIDFFLLQKDFYAKLTDKSIWLYIGIVFLGIRDISFYMFGMNSNNINYSNQIQFDIKTIAILLATILLIGFIDAIAFSYPVFDVIKHFKKKNESNSMSQGVLYSSLLTKVIKVYVIANILITPLDIVYYFTSKFALIYPGIMILTYISLVLGILGYFWVNGAITRGLCILFRVRNSAGLIFVLVFFWNALLSWAIDYLMNLVFIRL